MRCAVCDQDHPLDSPAFLHPDAVRSMKPSVRRKTVKQDSNTCVVTVGSESRYFVCGLLYVAFNEDPTKTIAWSIWVEVNQQGYDAVVTAWSPSLLEAMEEEEAAAAQFPIVPGKLANHIPGYLETVGLPVMLESDGCISAPEILLEDSDHPFVAECLGPVSIHRLLDWIAVAPPRDERLGERPEFSK
ncbi:MAG: DUF2199 domain-containing protein [Deltaproteobacteria bacterium]|nr:DUF2199 domain-containing protein [Deltaproteobacteria bacterium]